jgi:hypothetical protein
MATEFGAMRMPGDGSLWFVVSKDQVLDVIFSYEEVKKAMDAYLQMKNQPWPEQLQ